MRKKQYDLTNPMKKAPKMTTKNTEAVRGVLSNIEVGPSSLSAAYDSL